MEAESKRGGGAEPAWPALLGVMGLRLFLLTALLGILSHLISSDSVAFFALMAMAYVVSIPYALWLRNRDRAGRLSSLQFLVDLVLVTGVVYFTGGWNSDLSLLYPLVILSAGMVSTPLRAAQATVLSILAYLTLLVLLRQGVLVPYGPSMDSSEWGGWSKTVFLRVMLFMCFGAAAIYMSGKCHYADARIERFRKLSEIIFHKVGAGLIVFDEKGLILMANEQACAILGLEEKTLLGSALKEYMTADWVQETAHGAGDLSQCYFKRSDGRSVPVSFEIATVALPSEIVAGHREKGTIDGVIMAFHDISPILEMQERIKDGERIQAANEMAAEIAHEIRNPLAAISGSVQVLQRLERRAFLGDQNSASILLNEKNATFDRIVNESSRLDQTIERFIDFTEYSPEAFAKLQEYLNTSDFTAPRQS